MRGLSKSTAFERINTMKWLMYKAVDDGWLRKHPFKKFECRPEYKKRPFLSEEDLLRLLRVKLSYKRQRAFRDMFVFMCFSGSGPCRFEGADLQRTSILIPTEVPG